MRLNDWLTRTLGVRIVRTRHLEALGLMKSSQETKRFRDEALAAVNVMERFNGKWLTPALTEPSYCNTAAGHDPG